MNKEEFSVILKELGYNDIEIGEIWNERPSDDLDANILRKAAISMIPKRDAIRKSIGVLKI